MQKVVLLLEDYDSARPRFTWLAVAQLHKTKRDSVYDFQSVEDSVTLKLSHVFKYLKSHTKTIRKARKREIHTEVLKA
jgi:hypothetical protein